MSEREDQSKTLGFTASEEDLEMFDKLQRKYYALSKSAILRKIFRAGAERILFEEKEKA